MNSPDTDVLSCEVNFHQFKWETFCHLGHVVFSNVRQLIVFVTAYESAFHGLLGFSTRHHMYAPLLFYFNI